MVGIPAIETMNLQAFPSSAESPAETVDASAAVAVLGRRTLLAAVVCGILIRFACLGLIDYQFWTGDAVAYDRLATNLVEHGVYSLSIDPPYSPTVVRAPLLPLELASFYRVFGHHHIVPQLFQILLGAGAFVALALAVAVLEMKSAPAGKQGHPPRVQIAPWVLWLTLLSPFDAVYCGHLLSEALCTSCLVGAMVSPILWRRFGWLASGFFFGGAALSRDVFLVLIPAVALMLVIIGFRRAAFAALKRAAPIMVLGSAVAILPWTARNYVVTGHVVPVSKGLGLYNLWVGTWERNGDWVGTLKTHIPEEAYRTPEEKARVEKIVETEDPEAREEQLGPLIAERFRTEPGQILWTWAKRSYKPWVGTRFDLFKFRPALLARGRPAWILAKAGLFALNSLVLLAGAIGIVLSLRDRSPLLWFAIPIAYCAVIYIPFHNVETRYTQPVYAFLLVFVAVAIVAIQGRYAAYRTRPRASSP